MKVVNFVRGRYIGSEDISTAFQTYLAFVALEEGANITTMDFRETYNFAFGHLDAWIEDLLENHETHLLDSKFNRILEQYLVTTGTNGV